MSIIKTFAEKHGKNWEEIFEAENLTQDNFKKIRNEFANGQLPISSSDADIVVFGSIARNECTSGSDVDWTLLVDGQASSNHLSISQAFLNNLIKGEFVKPADTGLFGQVTFSHDLIHYIGGQDDTNHNLSRRILLLLESQTLLENSGGALDRVINAIIEKYIDNDTGFEADGKEKVPRFLLNDIIRYWRTICVDFAYKQIEQNGQKWALRNIKLRMARRLIFVKGLLMCAKLYKTSFSKDELKIELRKFVDIKPLEFMVTTFLDFHINESIIIDALDSYNDYLKMLNNIGLRDRLKALNRYEAYSNPEFLCARENSHKFQKAIQQAFLVDNGLIKDFTLKYGVF